MERETQKKQAQRVHWSQETDKLFKQFTLDSSNTCCIPPSPIIKDEFIIFMWKRIAIHA